MYCFRLLFKTMDIINALQGVILFVVLIISRKRVLRSLFKKLRVPPKVLNILKMNENEDDYSDDILTSDSDAPNKRNYQKQTAEEIQMS